MEGVWIPKEKSMVQEVHPSRSISSHRVPTGVLNLLPDNNRKESLYGAY